MGKDAKLTRGAISQKPTCWTRARSTFERNPEGNLEHEGFLQTPDETNSPTENGRRIVSNRGRP